MTEDERTQIASFRFQVIAPLVTRELVPGEQARILQELTERVWDIPGSRRSRIHHRTIERLYQAQKKAPVLVLDEAHELSNMMVREIRYITNVGMDSLSPFALIIVGQPELRGILKLKAFEAVAQRVEIRYHLGGMDPAETKAYLEHGAKVAGVDRPLFAEGAVSLLHSQSRGLPRLLGNLTRAALLDAAIRKQEIVEETNVRRAMAELQEG